MPTFAPAAVYGRSGERLRAIRIWSGRAVASLPFARGDLREELECIEPLRRHRDHAVHGL